MKLFIIDDNTEAEIFIYGIDGSDCTERFFVSFFDGKGIKKLTEEEKKQYKTEADYAILNSYCECLENAIALLQETIDIIAEEYKRSGCNVKETYTFCDRCYVV